MSNAWQSYDARKPAVPEPGAYGVWLSVIIGLLLSARAIAKRLR